MTALEKPKISFFFPACNEEDTVEELARRADKVLRELTSDYEVIIGLSDGIISVFFSPTLAKILATMLVALVLVYRPTGLFGARTT